MTVTYQLSLNLFGKSVENNERTSSLFFTTKKLSRALVELLKRVTIQEVQGTFYLSVPSTRVYGEFKKLLPLFDGRWEKDKAVHVCSKNPQPVIDQIIRKGFLPDINPYDFYPTPESIVENEIFPAVGLKTFDLYQRKPYYLFEDIQGEGLTIFDPSAGDGSLLKPFIKKYPKANFFAGEIDGKRRAILEKHPAIGVLGSDFLATDITQDFDYVVMNPPFKDVVCNNQTTWIDHIKKAFSLVSWRGSLASVVPETCFLSEHQHIVDFRNWVLSFGEAWQLPRGAFRESGTGIQTRVISLQKEDELSASRMWEPTEGYPSKFAYQLCLALDNERTVHDALQQIELDEGNREIEESQLRQQLGVLVREFVATEMKRDVNYFCDDRVHYEATTYLLNEIRSKE